MTELEALLYMILVDHDVSVQYRNSQRTQLWWPDLSDIHKRTRSRIQRLYTGTQEDRDELGEELGMSKPYVKTQAELDAEAAGILSSQMTRREELEVMMMDSLLSTGRWDDDELGISIVLGFD